MRDFLTLIFYSILILLEVSNTYSLEMRDTKSHPGSEKNEIHLDKINLGLSAITTGVSELFVPIVPDRVDNALSDINPRVEVILDETNDPAKFGPPEALAPAAEDEEDESLEDYYNNDSMYEDYSYEEIGYNDMTEQRI